MTALEALRKIETERKRVPIDAYTFENVEKDEDGNLLAMNVCAGDMGFEDEFEEIEQALKRDNPVLVKAKSYDKGVDAYRCPKCNGLVDRYHAYCSDCGQKLDRKEVYEHELKLIKEITNRIRSHTNAIQTQKDRAAELKQILSKYMNESEESKK